jgi:hypothetical protein
LGINPALGVGMGWSCACRGKTLKQSNTQATAWALKMGLGDMVMRLLILGLTVGQSSATNNRSALITADYLTVALLAGFSPATRSEPLSLLHCI